MRLVDNWRGGWKWWSVRLNLIGNALLWSMLGWPDVAREIWASLPDEIKMLLPTRTALWIPALIFVAGLIARYIQQGKKADG